MGRETLKFIEDIDISKSEKIAKDCIRKPSVYFLFNEDELVYVGKSINDPIIRITNHLVEGKKIFTTYSSIEIPEGIDIELAERLLIDRYAPIYNRDSRFQKQQRNLAKLLKIPLEENFAFEIKISIREKTKNSN